MKLIAEYEVNDSFTGVLLVKDTSKGMTKNNSPYIRATLGDKSGEVVSMLWDADDRLEQTFQTGNVVEIVGTIGEYQGKKQLNVNEYRLCEEDKEHHMDKLIKVAPKDPNVLLDGIGKVILSIQNDNIRNLTTHIVKKYEEKLRTHPAARSNHHAYMGGLIWHTFSMLKVGIRICELYPILNRDLVLAGIILHDIGKIREYSGYMDTSFTLEGHLKGHITIIDEEIIMTAKELGIEGEEVLLLSHIVLSHHRNLEWGSPVRPHIVEAMVVHMIDNLDASIESYTQASKTIEIGQFTEKIFSLDNVPYYKHYLSPNENQ